MEGASEGIEVNFVFMVCHLNFRKLEGLKILSITKPIGLKKNLPTQQKNGPSQIEGSESIPLFG